MQILSSKSDFFHNVVFQILKSVMSISKHLHQATLLNHFSYEVSMSYNFLKITYKIQWRQHKRKTVLLLYNFVLDFFFQAAHTNHPLTNTHTQCTLTCSFKLSWLSCVSWDNSSTSQHLTLREPLSAHLTASSISFIPRDPSFRTI